MQNYGPDPDPGGHIITDPTGSGSGRLLLGQWNAVAAWWFDDINLYNFSCNDDIKHPSMTVRYVTVFFSRLMSSYLVILGRVTPSPPLWT